MHPVVGTKNVPVKDQIYRCDTIDEYCPYTYLDKTKVMQVKRPSKKFNQIQLTYYKEKQLAFQIIEVIKQCEVEILKTTSGLFLLSEDVGKKFIKDIFFTELVKERGQSQIVLGSGTAGL